MVDVHVLVLSCGFHGLLPVVVRMAQEAAAGISCRFTVIDNASAPPYTPAMFEGEVHLIRRDRSAGFARAHNHAVLDDQAEFRLLLNNDVLLHPQAVNEMLNVMKRFPRAGAVGSRLVYPSGKLQHAGTGFGLAADGGGLHTGAGLPNRCAARTPLRVQAVTAACMLVRSRAWDAVSGLSESYEFGGEDVDFCLRLNQAGWQVYCARGADSLHFESLTPGRIEKDIPARKTFVTKWKKRVTHDQ